MGSFNHGQRNCDEFGGEPFYGFNGLVAHRGSSTRKISSMHPVTTNKRTVYKNDGSGRDGYISVNNGGLSVHNICGVNGTDQNQIYSDNLRLYGRDNVSPAARISNSVRIADNFIAKTLKIEDADYSANNMRFIGREIERANRDKSNDAEKMNRFKRNSQNGQFNTVRADMPTTQDVTDMLASSRFTKQDLYFRNQEKLM